MTEKRKYPRIVGNLALKLSGSDCDIVTETKNISGNGAYCAVDVAIAPMTKLEILLLIPLKKNNHKGVRKINCKGVVVRNDYVKDNGRHSYCLGIYFNEIKENDRKFLMAYIDSISNTAANNIF